MVEVLEDAEAEGILTEALTEATWKIRGRKGNTAVDVNSAVEIPFPYDASGTAVDIPSSQTDLVPTGETNPAISSADNP